MDLNLGLQLFSHAHDAKGCVNLPERRQLPEQTHLSIDFCNVYIIYPKGFFWQFWEGTLGPFRLGKLAS